MPPFLLHAPLSQTCPVVFTSAHSGRDYPAEFIAAARLDPLALRRSEDAFVDELFADAPRLGAPLLTATFARAYCDANREAWELDPTMFDDALPDWVNSGSERVQAGLGTIARVVASGEPIYARKLAFAEADRRVRACWQPWHDALHNLVAQTKDRFGQCLLIDCHSMPSRTDAEALARPCLQPDFVLGDLHGTSCGRGLVRDVQAWLAARGYTVARNNPYAGGFITRHYGRPETGVHVLQLEIARDLYLDELSIEKLPQFDKLRRVLGSLIETLSQRAASLLG